VNFDISPIILVVELHNYEKEKKRAQAGKNAEASKKALRRVSSRPAYNSARFSFL